MAQSAKNRAFRYKSSEALMRFLWAFRFNPLRSGGNGEEEIYRQAGKVKKGSISALFDFFDHWFFDD